MATDHGLCSGCYELIDVSETWSRHKKNKYHARCYTCQACQTALRGSMIERGTDALFCLSCASNGFQPKLRSETSASKPEAPFPRTTTTSGRAWLTSSAGKLPTPPPATDPPTALAAAKPSAPKAVPGKSAPVAVPSASPSSGNTSPLTSSGSSNGSLSRSASFSPVVSSSSFAVATPPTSPNVLASTVPTTGSPAVGSPFGNAPPPVRTSFRLQLSSAVVTAAKVAAARNALTSSSSSGSLTPAPPSSLSSSGSWTPPPAPPPFSSLHSASASQLFSPATLPVAAAVTRSSTDRSPVIIGSHLRSSGGGGDAHHATTSAPASMRTQPVVIVGSPASPGIVKQGTRRVPGNVVASLPPPPTLGSTPSSSSPLACNTPPPTAVGGGVTTPRAMPQQSPRAQPITTIASSPRVVAAPIATQPVPAPARLLSDLDAEEEAIRKQMEVLDEQERELRVPNKPLSPRRAADMHGVITSASVGRPLEPDRIMRLQRHPNSKKTAS